MTGPVVITTAPVAEPADLHRRILTIDGTTAAGRNTLGRTIAYEYGAWRLYTGLTVRSAADALTRDAGLEPRAFAEQFVHQPGVGGWDAMLSHPGGARPDLWDRSLDATLRTVSTVQAWRDVFVGIHRAIIRDFRDAGNPLIVIGHDTAKILAPDAFAHVGLTADYTTRSRRRERQFHNFPNRSTLVGPLTDQGQAMRDHLRGRDHAIVIDSTYVTREQVAEIAIRHIGDIAQRTNGDAR